MIRELSELEFFLGIQFRHNEIGLHLNQSQYLFDLLRSYALDNLRASVNPMITNEDLCSMEKPIDKASEY